MKVTLAIAEIGFQTGNLQPSANIVNQCLPFFEINLLNFLTTCLNSDILEGC